MRSLRKLPPVIALAACVFAAPPAAADTRRQAAGACEIYAPVPEDPVVNWDYWWSGRCVAGLASGPGFLLEYMAKGGFGDVYGVAMSGGRMKGEVRAHGPAFLGIEWTISAGAAGESDGWPEAWQPVDAQVSRFELPLALQEALVRFAKDVGHPQMPALAVVAGNERCRASIEVEARPGELPQKLDVAGFIRSHGNYEAARRDALLQAMAAHEERGASAERQLLARTWLALATAVIGCR